MENINEHLKSLMPKSNEKERKEKKFILKI